MDKEREVERSIGELAAAADVTVRTVRHYESVGLLPPAERSWGGHRRYDEGALHRLQRVRKLRELGFGLATIARLMENESAPLLLESTKRQLERTQLELEVSERLRTRLRRIVRLLEESGGLRVDQLITELEEDDVPIELTSIYTGLGDAGQTDLADATRVEKIHPVIEAGGALDELGAQIGFVLATANLSDLHRATLKRVNNDLMDIGSDLATPLGPDGTDSHPRISSEYVEWLERACDSANDSLDSLESFVSRFGTPSAAALDVGRAICRRAERQVLRVEETNPHIVRYLNRLSDLLFILSRVVADGDETLWKPGRGAEVAAG